MKQAKIIGTGSYLPKKILTNADLEKIVDTSDEWIVSRTGMRERRIAAEDEYTSDMGLKAAEKALEKAGVAPEDIDLILVATLTPDHVFPSTAALIQAKLSLTNAAAMDVQAACSGYVYALAMARAFIESGAQKNILIVAAEKLSSIVDYEDRTTCILFGDGAAACIVSCEGKGLVITETALGCDGTQAEILWMPAGGSKLPASKETVEAKQHCIKMNGQETFKHAVRRMEASCKECLDKAGLKEEEKRLKALETEEVIIAFDSTLEGDATALFIKQKLDVLGIRTTRLAFGLPMGSSLDYVDYGTLEKALTGRQTF